MLGELTQSADLGTPQRHSRRALRFIDIATCVLIALLVRIYWSGLQQMVHQWLSDETYGHGLLVPFITGYLIWRARHRVGAAPVAQQWWGLLPLIVGAGLYFLGEIGALYVLVQLSLWFVGLGLLIAAQGMPRAKRLAFPLCYLLTAIPLPQFLYQGLSSQMQLLSSAAGVGWLQMIGITAFRDGNVIDLGPIQLQVVDACSGLRYLFPLCSLALLFGYLHRGGMWQRIILVLSSLPLAILLNGLRIAAVGILIESFGLASAEGFLHLFEGWVIFLVSVGILWVEMLLLNRISSHATRPMTTAIGDAAPLCAVGTAAQTYRSYAVAAGLVLALAVAAGYTVQREDLVPSRRTFIDFPMRLGKWSGTVLSLEEPYRNTLKLDDYLLADYHTDASFPVTLYAAYYHSQRKGQSVHSPQSCIPGGGWDIVALEQRSLPTGLSEPHEMTINRVVIAKAHQTQIVYYWFKQRSRSISNEYPVKGYLVWDALAHQRTDGALVRLSAPVGEGQSALAADARLSEFAALVVPLLDTYIPD
jgi:exosortase D (VPLPA-CTERM-specific)